MPTREAAERIVLQVVGGVQRRQGGQAESCGGTGFQEPAAREGFESHRGILLEKVAFGRSLWRNTVTVRSQGAERAEGCCPSLPCPALSSSVRGTRSIRQHRAPEGRHSLPGEPIGRFERHRHVHLGRQEQGHLRQGVAAAKPLDEGFRSGTADVGNAGQRFVRGKCVVVAAVVAPDTRGESPADRECWAGRGRSAGGECWRQVPRAPSGRRH